MDKMQNRKLKTQNPEPRTLNLKQKQPNFHTLPLANLRCFSFVF
jgi:hypothetical protein